MRHDGEELNSLSQHIIQKAKCNSVKRGVSDSNIGFMFLMLCKALHEHQHAPNMPIKLQHNLSLKHLRHSEALFMTKITSINREH